ncbi:MAG: ABC transporter permease subunit [Nitrosomonadales bacterium]|nr:ABC transporter permease subunit [Nitrosomonadales bacterium]
MIFTIARKELRSLFAAPSTWLILGALQFILAWFFLVRMDAFLQVQAQLAHLASAPGATQAVAAPLFGAAALMLMLLVPVFTMRMIAEERRNRTLALLLTAPVSCAQIVLGKFVGLLLFLLPVVAGCLLMVSALGMGTQLDNGLLLANALGLLLLAASYGALGLYVSSLTAQPAVAAIAALAALSGLWLVETGAAGSDSAWRALAPTSHFESFNAGLFDSGDLVYFLVFCAAFLLLAVRRLNNNRMYG